MKTKFDAMEVARNLIALETGTEAFREAAMECFTLRKKKRNDVIIALVLMGKALNSEREKAVNRAA